MNAQERKEARMDCKTLLVGAEYFSSAQPLLTNPWPQKPAITQHHSQALPSGEETHEMLRARAREEERRLRAQRGGGYHHAMRQDVDAAAQTHTQTISKIAVHTGIYKLHLDAQATLRTGSVRASVKLPLGVGTSAWYAAQTLGIYEEVLQLVSLLQDICTQDCCPTMSAGKCVVYSWKENSRTCPQKLCASEYMKALVTYANRMLSDRDLIPIDGRPFPDHFVRQIQQLHKYFFRVYAHAYLHHFDVIQAHGAEAHLNCSFKHFLFFVQEFDLVCEKDLRPLRQLIEKFNEQARRHDEQRDSAVQRQTAAAFSPVPGRVFRRM
jgi:MOB kinase activator 1